MTQKPEDDFYDLHVVELRAGIVFCSDRFSQKIVFSIMFRVPVVRFQDYRDFCYQV